MAARRPGPLALVRSVLVLPAVLFVAGVVAAMVVLWLDRALPGAPLAGVLGFEPTTARTLLATGAGSILSIAAFTFWMRMVVVQLVTSTFSPRLLAQFLEDRFQRTVMAAMIGAFGFVVTVLREIPSEGTAVDVPQLAVGTATLVIGLAAAGILVSIRVSVHTLDNGRLVHTIASSITEVIETVYPTASERLAVDDTRPDGDGAPVRIERTGWVTAIDDMALLERLPPDTVVEFDVRTGSFQVPNTVVAHVWPADVSEDVVDAVAAAVHTAPTRSPLQDLEYGLRQLVDVGEQSLTTSAPDSGTANEVLGHLGAVLDRIICSDPPPAAHGDTRGRRILRPNELTQDQLFRGAVAPLRQAGSGYPHVAKDLLTMLQGLHRRAVERGLAGHCAAIEREAALVVEGAFASPAVLPADAEEVAETARSCGLPTSVDELESSAVSIPAVT